MIMTVGLISLLQLTHGATLAAPVEPGRLFYTPAQRAQLEAARAHNVTQTARRHTRELPVNAPPPLRYDGIVIRSDGQATRWVDGKAQVGPSSVSGLKPGQTRANGKVYEPYQLLRPAPASPAGPDATEPAP
jgi:hypothetical protein